MAKDDNKQKLIKATDALLKDRSITSITTKEITKTAGVSVGVFYNYFSSKEDVFKELIKIFFNYSLKQMKVLRKEVTGKNIRSEIKFKEFLINGIDNNWENHFLNSDILLLSRKDEEFQKLMIYFNQKMVSIVVEILTVINPELQEDPPLLEAKMIMNLIQNSYPSFSKFDNEDEKERYIEKFVNIIFSISFNE
ncbi:TetR/AcrR family transcriptional regulator [Streptococcus equi subsp. zooepidemicus Sz16]|uniref:TetR/AcrR family transcriptional regulator n=1 Tax=Streptococcus equi TaxID=1336 RepID=UPI0005B90925|nr:TetR/AcrR family transcriptional regulator [Streptococcus equi]KIS07017.1 TetR/AcrR family transcriptional regulator [Streptococcus equi subsp. zooepidemicus Sz16]KIS10555.1 TetR/AcrR family transcriptional regulator [Streptococcus equi subsp. zooepidemicus SzAM60]KIS15277.1 TetR/AcrR family transcriptional regulator [Streptococcus equi subsp. zooepidemicus SzAM35]MCD3444625.1 TetR/AcrR family transcriptional regulator [Streptococcus equi subsp. zooepidemicus]MDI5945884.1 TetR/AcrR family t